MTTPTLGLGISATGTAQVLALSKAVADLKQNLLELAAAGGKQTGSGAAVVAELRKMRQEMGEAMAGIRTDLAAGFSKAYSAAAQATAEGGEKLAKATREAASKVRVAGRVDLGNGFSASVSGPFGQKSEVQKLVSEVKQSGDALAAEYSKQITRLETQVANVMKAATQGPNTMRGKGYISWWEQVIKDMEAGEAKLLLEQAKATQRLDAQVEKIMKAATQGPNTMRGKGYISWWDQVIKDMEAGEAKLQLEQAKATQRLDAQVEKIMKAATQGPNTMRGKGYISWWDQVIKDMEAGEAKLLLEQAKATQRLDAQVEKIMKAATQGPNTMRGKGYISWWEQVIKDMEAGEAKLLLEQAKATQRLDAQVEKIMKAATQGPNTMRGKGYISWWDQVIKDMEAGEAKLLLEQTKATQRLDAQVEKIMKAATQGPNTMRGKGYISWWEQVIKDMEAGEAKLLLEQAKATQRLDAQVEKIMKAATQGPNTMRGKGYISWWDQVIKDMEAGEAKLLLEQTKATQRLDAQVEKIMKAATQGPNTMRGKGYISWWEQVIKDMEAGEAKLLLEQAKATQRLDAQVEKIMKAATQGPNTMRGKGYISWWDQVIKDMEAGEAKLRARMATEATMMDAEVARYRSRRLDALGRSAQAQVNQAMAGDGVGKFSSIVGSNYGTEVKKAAEDTHKLTKGLLDAHSAARGLASGFGLMWLTWGQVVPLLAGAAISHSFVQVVKQGAEVQHTFETIRVLSEESAEAVGGLNRQMSELAKTGPFGPREIAEAMKIMSLAGLDASAVAMSVKDVLNFAVAGTTSIKTAADVMTTVATAFRISADGYNYVGDVIAKTAAISKSSVESIGEAFKTASVVNSQYGASLEDVGLGLALLSNVGIQGTAAGTALRNMYVDILGRTPKVQKALKELTGDATMAFDKTTGKARDLISIFTQLEEGLSKKTPIAQTKLLQDIFSERGGKEAIEVLNKLREVSEKTGETVVSQLHKMKRQIDEAAGFVAVSAATLALTPLNQMKSVVASLQDALISAFAELEPYILDTVGKLKGLFNSEEFRTSVQVVTRLMAEGIYAVVNATTFLVSNFDKIVRLLLTSIAPLNLAVSLWERLHGKNEQAVANTYPALLNSLRDEAKRLREINEAKERGLDLDQLKAEKAIRTAQEGIAAPLDVAQKALDQARAKKAKAPEGAQPYWDKEIAKLEIEHNLALKIYNAQRLDLVAAQASVELESLKQKNRLQEEVARREKTIREQQIKMGGMAGELPGKEDKFAKQKQAYDNELATLKSSLDKRNSELKTSYDAASQLLEARHKHELVSEGEYQAQVLLNMQNFEAEQRLLTQQSMAAMGAAYQNMYAKLSSQPATKGTAQALKNLRNKYDEAIQGALTLQKNMDTSAFLRQEKATIELEGETRKLLKTGDEYWAKADQAVQKEAALAKVRWQNRDATEEQVAALEAATKVEEQHLPRMAELQRLYYNAQVALEGFNASIEGAPLTDELLAKYRGMEVRVAALLKMLQVGESEIKRLQGIASSTAVEQVGNKRFDDMSKQISSTLADSILDGTKEGLKGVGDWAKNYFLKKPLKVFLEAVFKPIGNFAATIGTSLIGGFTGSASAGTASNIGSGIGMVSSLAGGASAFGSGFASGLTAWGEGGSVMGLLGQGSNLFAGGMANGIGTIAGALGPVVAAIAAIYMIAQSFKGETRSGGHYGYSAATGKASFLHGPSGGDPAGREVSTLIQTTGSNMNTLLTKLGTGLTLTSLQGAYESSGKDRGGVYFGGTLSNGITFGESGQGSNYDGTQYEKTSSQSPSTEEALKNFTTDTLQGTIQMLQAAADYVPQTIRAMTEGIVAESLTDTQASDIITAISKVTDEVVMFQAAVMDMPFEYLKNISFDTAAALAKAAGGMDKLMNSLSSYYKNYFSEEEQKQQTAKNIQRVLKQAGADFTVEQILLGDKNKFRTLTDYWGAQKGSFAQGLWSALISVNEAFATLAETAEDTAKTADELRQEYLDALDTSFSVYKRAMGVEIDLYQAKADAAKEMVDALKSLFDLLSTSSKELYSEVSSTAAMQAVAGRAFISQALGTAKTGGGLPTTAEMTEAISAARSGLDPAKYASKQAYDFDKLVLAGELRELQNIVGPQLTTAEATLKAAEDQVDLLQKQLAYWEELVNVARDGTTATLTVAQAVADLAARLGKPVSGAPGSTGSTAGATTGTGGASFGPGYSASAGLPSSGYIVAGGIPVDIVGHAMANLSNPQAIAEYGKANGATMADYARLTGQSVDAVQTWFNLQGVQSFAVGTPFVPQDQLAFIHQGEAILPAATAQKWRDDSGGLTATEIRRLQAQVQQLIEVCMQTMINTRRTADIEDRWDIDGLPLERTA